MREREREREREKQELQNEGDDYTCSPMPPPTEISRSRMSCAMTSRLMSFSNLLLFALRPVLLSRALVSWPTQCRIMVQRHNY